MPAYHSYVLPCSALAATDRVETSYKLDSVEELRHLVTKLAFDSKAQGAPCAMSSGAPFKSYNRLPMIDVHEIETFVVWVASTGVQRGSARSPLGEWPCGHASVRTARRHEAAQ